MYLHVNVIEVHHANNVEVDHVQGKDLAVIDTEMIEDASDIWKLWWNDTGCSVITISQTVALNLHLTQHPSSQPISGYAGGITRAIGETTINLTVDLITSQVTALVVLDSVQSVPIIIGQPFLNRAGVTMVMRDGKIRLFERHLAALPDIDNLPSPRVTVYSKDDCVIPANTVGYIGVCCPDHVIGDVFIEGSTRQRPGQEYNIPSCITSVKNGVIAVRNTSPTDVHFAKKQLLARGTVCSPASTTEAGEQRDLDDHFEGIVSTDKVKPYIDDMNDSEETGSDESSNTLDDK
ncbi:hypothetical protein NQ318_017191 [Aromia moschata]|uniref:Uncharacterized protein n=1 Tax=Aromia moschata TaxID=1265417 RepID=A0AAV8YQC2_9CUCU|nr:hypothetical protein NQ318_017191 [Aromia moschata]